MNIPIIQIPSAEYHAESRNGHYLSSHLLADFRQSPQLYHREVSGEIAQTESPALALGRAAHCLILEGRMAFDDQYLVSDGPVNARTNEPYGKTTKSYSDWLAAQTKEVLSCRDYGFITKLQKSVWTHPTASALLDDGASEATVRASYCDVPCQIRMDWSSPRTRHRRPQDLRQPQMVRGRLQALRIHPPDGILPRRPARGHWRDRPRPPGRRGEERAVQHGRVGAFRRRCRRERGHGRGRSTRGATPTARNRRTHLASTATNWRKEPSNRTQGRRVAFSYLCLSQGRSQWLWERMADMSRNNQRWRFANSLPEPDFRYASKAYAFSLLSKAMAV